MSLAVNTELSKRHYAACLLVRDRIDGKIGQLGAQVDKSKDRHAAELLAYLYRAKGDLANARKAAEIAGNLELQEDILRAANDWKGLVKLLASPAANVKDPTPAGVLATYQRLAGNQDEFKKSARPHARDAGDPWLNAKIMILKRHAG